MRVARATAVKPVRKVLPPMPVVDEARIDFETIELLFFAYRDFVSDPDAILSRIGMGRAHHRVVYFVCRQPGMMVTDLLDILQITKQSLARVLKQLIELGYIRQMAGAKDRRQRRLYPTLAGRELALALSEPQSRRIANAMESMTPEGVAAVKEFLRRMRGRDEALGPIDADMD
ncbi:MarR family transcriptional regulator [Rhizobium sp. NTR19]|uniref:MarR family transcriptional regulator n=1 Tax=Neorhizobium turbinariae TaxID=2937795 RepID=A0ABT0IKS2_9HYPH|nr:MarR family transcriptional regulator [Neorhizobium turbinariae]MCK8778475.1 MarR family transcriptional regulator [Neorhizobium turbinariae]